MLKFTTPSRLRAMGIIGMNQRNIDCIARNNPRRLYPLVDNKLKTKELLAQDPNITTPTLLGVVRSQRHVQQINGFLEGIEQFVVKPAKGSGGKGIMVVTARDQDEFVKASGTAISLKILQHHLSNTLSGLYSLGGIPDVAMIEALVDFDNVFDGFTFEGVPDIRVILYFGYPIMAMTRLSTSNSDGKANLHQGAVGLGIDIATGTTLRAIQKGKPITHHPDTGRNLSDLRIPDWKNLLLLASRCFEVTQLGYLGADIVLDRNKGPMLLELNARPGLAIQVANGMGLAPRLDAIDRAIATPRNAEQRVAHAMELFSS